ncbi:VWA-like domain-containing protein [uncultured Roseobacter sp.]|uniref:vWA domain-containing protein n=1 Tax=uncultured Roseobacter sp. TaxID=114847 RepID=UPI00261AB812|nr:VWA-like domain-containing protein [uncultured Roseobacter sp.]
MVQRSRRAERALAHLPGADPGLAMLALWCDVTDAEDGTPDTITADHRIYVGETFAAHPMHEQIGLIGHHILHVALRHSARAQAMAARCGAAFEPEIYALACDAVANEILVQAGHALPRPAVLLRSLLRDVLLEPQEPEHAILAQWDTDRLYAILAAQDGRGCTRRQKYQQAHGFRPDVEPGAKAANGAMPPDEWRGHLVRAAGAAQGAGRGIGPLLAALAETAQDRTPWEVLLRRLLVRATSPQPGRSWRRPDRAWVAAEADARSRGGPEPVFQPGRSRDRLRPRIVIGMDSSGSVPDSLLARFSAEFSAIARRTGAEVHLMAFDETVYHHMAPMAGASDRLPDDFQVRRGGGTAFIDVVEKAAALRPSALVVLTDLEGPFGPAPHMPVIWAVPDVTSITPPFGEVITLTH